RLVAIPLRQRQPCIVQPPELVIVAGLRAIVVLDHPVCLTDDERLVGPTCPIGARHHELAFAGVAELQRGGGHAAALRSYRARRASTRASNSTRNAVMSRSRSAIRSGARGTRW